MKPSEHRFGHDGLGHVGYQGWSGWDLPGDPLMRPRSVEEYPILPDEPTKILVIKHDLDRSLRAISRKRVTMVWMVMAIFDQESGSQSWLPGILHRRDFLPDAASVRHGASLGEAAFRWRR